MLAKIGRALEKSIRQIEDIFCNVALVVFFILMILDTADVVGRYIFNRPITGTLEYSKLLAVVMVFLSWGYIQAIKAHIKVDLVISRFSPRAQVITDFVTSFIFLGLFSLIVWRAPLVAIAHWRIGLSLDVTQVPTAPFELLTAFGAFIVCLELIIQMVHLVPQMRRAG